MSEINLLPTAVIGAGPIGLAAAAHLIERGLPVKVLEAGENAGANIRAWGHVRLFSPWEYNVDEAARRLLRPHGWQEPPKGVYPTGSELVEAYLDPLAELPEIASVVETGARVTAIGRDGIDKVVSKNRADHPFVLTIVKDGHTRFDLARAVIDASGTWTTPNPMGANGMKAEGERELAEGIAYGLPDTLGRDRDHYAGRTTLVIGAGHSAANVLIDLSQLAESAPGTKMIWATRGTNLARV